jgi:hypothetical protein
MELPVEIVHVISETQLIDSESYQHALGRTHVNRLRPGFYVVHWPSIAAMSNYDESADFIGPYDTRHSAELAYGTLEWRFGCEVHSSSVVARQISEDLAIGQLAGA